MPFFNCMRVEELGYVGICSLIEKHALLPTVTPLDWMEFWIRRGAVIVWVQFGS